MREHLAKALKVTVGELVEWERSRRGRGVPDDPGAPPPRGAAPAAPCGATTARHGRVARRGPGGGPGHQSADGIPCRSRAGQGGVADGRGTPRARGELPAGRTLVGAARNSSAKETSKEVGAGPRPVTSRTGAPGPPAERTRPKGCLILVRDGRARQWASTWSGSRGTTRARR